jgi:hypothetical protein
VSEIPNLFTIHNVHDRSPQKKSIRVRSGLSGRAEDWFAPSNPGIGELLIQGFAHRLAKMRKCSVLHENDQIPSFSLQVFNLWGKIISKHILVIASSNGLLSAKKERAYNTVTEQPTPNFHRTMNVLVNFIWFL